MRFLDEAKIFVSGGAGGGGSVSFRREKFVEFGGPDGGDGGRGGSVIAVVDKSLNTLIDFRYRQHFRAARGGHGMGKNRSGRSGADIEISLPLGTQILSEDRSVLLGDLSSLESRIVLARGGDGGLGNSAFKSSVNRAPRQSGEGIAGESLWLWLRLKLLADVGLVGLPNAGKSTFLSAVSGARPKIAAYPFSTLHPQLGVVDLGWSSFVIADIPGLIRGAHSGLGLGVRFLGHIERCSILLYLLDCSSEDVLGDFAVLRRELSLYENDLCDKPFIVALSKSDLLDSAALGSLREALSGVVGEGYLGDIESISSHSGFGVPELLRRLGSFISSGSASVGI